MRSRAPFLEEERVRPLHADPFAGNVAGNVASVRRLERCGFQRVGTVRYGDNDHIRLTLDAPPTP